MYYCVYSLLSLMLGKSYPILNPNTESQKKTYTHTRIYKYVRKWVTISPWAIAFHQFLSLRGISEWSHTMPLNTSVITLCPVLVYVGQLPEKNWWLLRWVDVTHICVHLVIILIFCCCWSVIWIHSVYKES